MSLSGSFLIVFSPLEISLGLDYFPEAIELAGYVFQIVWSFRAKG